jgi:hypothetical protein
MALAEVRRFLVWYGAVGGVRTWALGRCLFFLRGLAGVSGGCVREPNGAVRWEMGGTPSRPRW